MKRTIAAFIIAPLIPAVLFAAGAGILASIAYSYLFSYVLGIPAFLVLQKKRKESHLMYGMVGLVIGLLYVIIPAAISLHIFDPNALLSALLFGALGASVALSFSAIRGNERKTA
jgi:hypothetical protein